MVFSLITISFTLSLLGFLALNVVVLSSAIITAFWLCQYKPKNLGYILLTIFILFSTQICTTQILLGIFGILNYATVWIINVMILIISIVFFGRDTIKMATLPALPDKKFLLLFGFIFSSFLTLFILRYTNALLQVPLSYDDLAYHLPFAVEWLKTGSILTPYYTAFAGPIGYYPSNFELLDLWMMLPFGNDILINIINAPVFFILIIALYSTARNFGASKLLSLCCAAVMITLPVTMRFLGTSLVDIFFVTTFVCSIYFLQEYGHFRLRKNLFFLGLSAGLCIGTKYLGIPYILPLVALIFIIIIAYSKNALLCHPELAEGHNSHLIYKKRIQHDRWIPFSASFGKLPPTLHFGGHGRVTKKMLSHILYNLVVMFFGLLISGGFWYMRNMWLTGNPIFPAEVSLSGFHIFDGYGNISEQIRLTSLAANITNISQLTIFLKTFSFATGILWMLIIAAWLIVNGFLLKQLFKLRDHHSTGRKTTLSLITASVLLPIFALCYWHAPYGYQILIPNIRYALPLLASGTLIIALCGAQNRTIEKAIIAATPLIIISNVILLFRQTVSIENRFFLDTSTLFQHPMMLLVTILLSIGLVCFAVNASNRQILKSCGFLFLTFIILSSLFSFSLPLREQYKEQYYSLWYAEDSHDHKYAITQAAHWLDEHAHDASIAYSGLNMHYPLFGRDLQRSVRYVNINNCMDCRYGDFKDAPDSIRTDPNFDAWMTNLRLKNIEYLVIDPVTLGIKSYEQEWIFQRPKQFEKVYEYGNVMVYQIKQ